MTYENLKLGYLYQLFSPFKKQDIYNFINLIDESRVGRRIKFKCYGNATFINEEDPKHEYVTITELDSFERKNTNVAVFEVTDEHCRDTYTEIFLYHNVTALRSSYGLVCYNSKTGKISHKIQIEYDLYDLMIALNKTMLFMENPNQFD